MITSGREGGRGATFVVLFYRTEKEGCEEKSFENVARVLQRAKLGGRSYIGGGRLLSTRGFYFCHEDVEAFPPFLKAPVLVVWMVLLFATIAITADNFFAPSVQRIAERLKLPEAGRGVDGPNTTRAQQLVACLAQ